MRVLLTISCLQGAIRGEAKKELPPKVMDVLVERVSADAWTVIAHGDSHGDSSLTPAWSVSVGQAQAGA